MTAVGQKRTFGNVRHESASPLKADVDRRAGHVRFVLPAQPVDATQALNFSAGVSNPRVLRGRSLSWRATLLRWACEYTDKSAPFGKYCLSRPLVFSLEPASDRSL
jgi:hypothetical protein